MPYRALRNFLRKLRQYDRINSFSKIARRYFVMNAFDGAITLFGLVIGSFLAGVTNPALVFSVGVSTCVAMGVSGLWGAFFTETAERKSELKDLEKQMMRKLGASYQGEATNMAAYITAAVNSLSPALGGFVMLIPFLLAHLGIGGITIRSAYLLSIIISFILFFLLGAFLGKISKDNALAFGVKMLMAGVASAVLIYLLSAVGVVSEV